MRALWILIALLVGGAIILLWQTAPSSSSSATENTPTNSGARASAVARAPSAPSTPASPKDSPKSPPVVAATPVPKTTTAPLAPLPGGLTIGLDKQIKGATVRAGRLEEKDGAILADGKYTIKGSGTAERPYEVSWELLMSASDTFIPRLGEKQIPQRIAMLDGAHIRISGYIAFPLIVTEASECLVMLNQWDGCCIGVPPSPYDAIEVKLAAPADNSRRHIVRVGTVEGIFRIDPYVVEKWLVGLYLLESATLDTEL